MKKIFKLMAAALSCGLLAAGVSSCYDDSELASRVEDLETKMAELQKTVQNHANQLTTLLSGDMVTNVTYNTDGSYVISFAKHDQIVIKPGEKGEKGEPGKDGSQGTPGTAGAPGTTPVISISQDTDGLWYWKANGEWLRDDSGKMVRANGIDGNDATAPQFEIREGNWYVSVDGGNTWKNVGKATGDSGDSAFSSIDLSSPDHINFVLSDGTKFSVARYVGLLVAPENNADQPVECKGGKSTIITVKMPSGLKAEEFAALKARIDYNGGTASDVATRATAGGWDVEVTAPTFAENGSCNNDASVTVYAPENEGETVLLEVSLILKNGSTTTSSQLVMVEVPVLSYSIENVGIYTLDVVCKPSAKCKAYTATIWSVAENSAFDEGPSGQKIINYEAMTAQTLKSFKESQTGTEGVQAYLISTTAHTYSEQDLVKNTPFSSDKCQGFSDFNAGKSPYAVYVVYEDIDGNYGIEYKEISCGTGRCNLTATITPGECTYDAISATITAPGASKILYYFQSKATGVPSFDPKNKAAKPELYDGPINFSTVGTRLSPSSQYYIVAMPIDAQGNVGNFTYISLSTTAVTTDGTAKLLGASFDDQTTRDAITCHLVLPEGATAVRTYKADKENFATETAGDINAILFDPYWAGSCKEWPATSQMLDITFTLDKVGNEWKPFFGFWASVKGADGKWGPAQNIAAIAAGADDDADASIFWPVITENPGASFTSDATITVAKAGEATATELSVNISGTGAKTLRLFWAEVSESVFLNTCVDGDNKAYSSRDLISDNKFSKYWMDYTAGTTVNLAGGSEKEYILLAAAIDAAGNFSEPFNAGAKLMGETDSEAFTKYTIKKTFGGENITLEWNIQKWFKFPKAEGGESEFWGGTCSLPDFNLTGAPTGAWIYFKYTKPASNFSNLLVVRIPHSNGNEPANLLSLAKAAVEDVYVVETNTVKSYGNASNGCLVELNSSGSVNHVANKYKAHNYVFIVSDGSKKCSVLGYYITKPDGTNYNTSTEIMKF
ncbi:MAG: hypothetical protein HUJ94_07320 [Bacteroidales bacterium]|nr:hypothetical protein [Bacteroidales bacterium]